MGYFMSNGFSASTSSSSSSTTTEDIASLFTLDSKDSKTEIKSSDKKDELSNEEKKLSNELFKAVFNCDIETVKKLVEKIKVGEKLFVNNNGFHILHVIAQHCTDEKYVRYMEILTYLKNKFPNDFSDFNVALKNRSKFSPLHVAAGWGNLLFVKWLTEDQKVKHCSDGSEGFPVHSAAIKGRTEIVKFFCNKDSKMATLQTNGKHGDVPFSLALVNGSMETVKYLVEEADAKPAINKNGYGLLHGIALCCTDDKGDDQSLKMWDYLEVKFKKDFDFSNFNVVTADGVTPMHCAASKGNKPFINRCGERFGSDIATMLASRNRQGDTPLDLAIKSKRLDTKRTIEVVEELLKLGAVIDNNDLSKIWKEITKNKKEDLAIFICKYLRNQFKTKITELQENLFKNLKKIADRCGNYIEPWNRVGSDGRTLLHFAAENDCEKLVGELLNEGVNDSFDKKGSSSVHLAACNGHTKIVKAFCERFSNLLTLRESNLRGLDPLTLAIISGHLETAQYLVEDKKVALSNSNLDLHIYHSLAFGDLSDEHLTEVVDWLQKKFPDYCSDLNVVNRWGHSPLGQAACLGNLPYVNWLIKRKVKLYPNGIENAQAHFFVGGNGLEIIEAIVEYVGYNILISPDRNGNTFLDQVVINDNPTVVTQVITCLKKLHNSQKSSLDSKQEVSNESIVVKKAFPTIITNALIKAVQMQRHHAHCTVLINALILTEDQKKIEEQKKRLKRYLANQTIGDDDTAILLLQHGLIPPNHSYFSYKQNLTDRVSGYCYLSSGFFPSFEKGQELQQQITLKKMEFAVRLGYNWPMIQTIELLLKALRTEINYEFLSVFYGKDLVELNDVLIEIIRFLSPTVNGLLLATNKKEGAMICGFLNNHLNKQYKMKSERFERLKERTKLIQSEMDEKDSVRIFGGNPGYFNQSQLDFYTVENEKIKSGSSEEEMKEQAVKLGFYFLDTGKVSKGGKVLFRQARQFFKEVVGTKKERADTWYAQARWKFDSIPLTKDNKLNKKKAPQYVAKSIEYLDNCLLLNPEHDDARIMKAKLLVDKKDSSKKGDLQEAKRLLNKIKTSTGESIQLQIQIENWLESKSPKRKSTSSRDSEKNGPPTKKQKPNVEKQKVVEEVKGEVDDLDVLSGSSSSSSSSFSSSVTTSSSSSATTSLSHFFSAPSQPVSSNTNASSSSTSTLSSSSNSLNSNSLSTSLRNG